jgi:peptidyl-lysine (3S)-dioxygenase / protease
MDLDSLTELSTNTKDLWTPRNITHINEPIESTTFLREYVSQSTPVVFCNTMRQWKCMRLWSLKYLASSCGRQEISVNVTPDGRADAIKPCDELDGARVFVAPEERSMTMQQFCNYLENPQLLDGIPYLSRQNDNLNEEFSSLLEDVPSYVPFAREAFGTDPEAVNLWIGDTRSFSSCHQDFYENM